MTPEEAWSGIKPSIEYFKVFVGISHVHVSDRKRTKWDDKSLICVLLGVNEESKAYQLYDPLSQRIIISRDVVFEEDKSWDRDKNEEAIACDLEWGDREEDVVELDGNEERNESDSNAYVEEEWNFSSDSVVKESSPSSNDWRIRRPLAWLQEYETGEGLPKEETQLAMFTAADPTHFEDAIKNEKWRKAMDV